ncbi:hypothetical protein [Stieleria mannarensis]|uniref:hypothetical protein n=1 Tax=Stieleria mannarensis TaxID=2755585 RepID=UPI001602E9B1|nr:hypothetical protein [Rhodopirellula sp. JC639]
MRNLLALSLVVVATVTVRAADLDLQLKRLSGKQINAAQVRYSITEFDQKGNPVGTVKNGQANFDKATGLTKIPLGNTANPLQVTVRLSPYTPIALEPLDATKKHDVGMIVNITSFVVQTKQVSLESERRVLGNGDLRFHLAGDASTVFDPQSNSLEVLKPIESQDPTYDLYRSENGGKWAIGKNVRVRCVIVRGKACWVKLGVPVWKTDVAKRRWVFRGYMQERHRSVVVETITIDDEPQKIIQFD